MCIRDRYRVSPWAPVWWSNTFVPGSRFLKTDTGAMAVLAPNGDPVWVVPATLPNGLFTIQDDGNLTLSSVANGVVWDSKGVIDDWAMTYRGLATIWTMPPNTLRTSPNGQYRLQMQGDGNLVVYTQDDKFVWASMTFGTGSCLLYTSMCIRDSHRGKAAHPEVLVCRARPVLLRQLRRPGGP